MGGGARRERDAKEGGEGAKERKRWEGRGGGEREEKCCLDIHDGFGSPSPAQWSRVNPGPLSMTAKRDLLTVFTDEYL